MRKFSILISLPVVLSLPLVIAGCSRNLVAYHPNKTFEEARQDKNECEYEAQKYSYTPFGAGRSGFSAGMQEGMQQVSLMKKCMEVKGYQFLTKEEVEARGGTVRPW